MRDRKCWIRINPEAQDANPGDRDAIEQGERYFWQEW